MNFLSLTLYCRAGPIASWGGGGPSEVHISIPHRNLSRGYVWGALIIKLLYYRGGSSYYLLRGSVNNIPMETGTSTVIHM